VGQVEYLLHRRGDTRDELEERECLEAIRQAALSGRDRLRELHSVLREATPAPAPPPAATARPRRPIPTSAGGCVLVVDDDADVREAFASLLGQAGYDVATARDGAEALEATRTRRFDSIVVDHGLPGLSGLAVTRIMRDRGLDAFVVLVTGDATSCDPREVEAAGVDRLMTKPFDRDELLGALGAGS
jgi:CheY-like chemotaxis protein